jgi:sulfatase maturation enzyme AslB (radical SAM superfamily)
MPNLEISTVVGCRMKCDYCPQNLHIKTYTAKTKETVMSLENYAHAISKVPTGVDIHFAGMAEPWLNPHATDMVLMAHEQGHKIQVYTTCYGMKLSDVERIKHIPFIYFCLHLPDADGIMKIEVTKDYLKVLSACLKMHNTTFTCIGKIHPEVERITGFIEDSSKSLISRAGNIKTLAITPKKGHLRCSSMPDKMDHNVLLPNGDVLLCCCDYANRHVLGNLLKIDYESLFESEVYKEIQEGLKDDNSKILCRTCEIAEHIPGMV